MKSNTEQLKIAEEYLDESCPKCCSMKNNCCCYFVCKVFKEAGNASLFYSGSMVTYCPNAIKWCKTQLAQIPPFLAMPSDVIFFDWNANNVPDHIGFVDHRIDDTQIATLEGNTTSKYVVARQVRPSKYVLGIFRPHFKASYDTSKALVIDGQFGYNSIAMLQKALGIKVDGILGLNTIKSLQKLVGTTQDGSWGVNTSKAVQTYLKKQGYYNGAVDGHVYEGTVKALQTWINAKVGKTTTTTDKTAEKKPQSSTEASATTTTGKYKVIDVSVWQGDIDWAKVKADGVVGAIIRYADGTTLDRMFDRNMAQAKANGIHIGSYIFSRAKTKAEAESEATRLYNACKPYAPDLPLYIDLEASTLGKYADTVAQAFLTKMKALGGRGGVYANLNWWNKYLTGTAKNYSSYPFWIAQYNSKVTHKTPSLFGMWQYSSSGKVNGISGKVDMDWLYKAYWETAPKPVEPTPEAYKGTLPSLTLKKSASEVVADALLFAKWIVGDNRFGYGRKGGAKYKGTKEYSITHSGGCHFCGSNATKITKAKNAGLSDPDEWEFTYVCNTLVHACYAHAGVPSMLSAKGHSWWTKQYQNSKYWEEIKKPSKVTDLKPGDVLASESHFALYYGNGKIAEATSQGDASASKEKWASSIHFSDGASFFKKVDHVFRLKSGVDTSALIRYGEVSERVKLVQKFLNWYNGKAVVAEDGIFGDTTLEYVKAFQTAQRIAIDGIIGNGTLAKMASVKK